MLTFGTDRVAFVTGAARGQGRSHAVMLAKQGVSIVAVDICAPVETVPYKASTKQDLDTTVGLIKAEGVDAIGIIADVRDLEAMKSAAAQGLEHFGRIDYLVANAGILSLAGKVHEFDAETWQTMIDVNLTGVFNAARAVLPAMLDAGFGRIVATTSGTVRHTGMHVAHYAAAKAGVLSVIKSVAIEYADKNIRANTVSPSNVGTDMILNDAVYRLYYPDKANPTLEDVMPRFASIHATGNAYVEPVDISYAVAYLLSDQSQWITGIELPVLAGRTGGF
ncbi:mycofactocin-coupled SDR family oxidoreductase [Cryptosporangium sp. NPDC048952]|uniref:mycofactocin-coupled SDR family oxidoreductase n=1 Tax=Cryptosporangium sp. NPDC048952 TaxID=3363961 RepID=UPI0037227FA8